MALIDPESLAIQQMSALSTPSRLAAFKKLAEYGERGVPSTDLALLLDVPQNTLSTQLQILAAARLVLGQRDGRRIIYRADIEAVGELMAFLGRECTRGELRIELKPRSHARIRSRRVENESMR